MLKVKRYAGGEPWYTIRFEKMSSGDELILFFMFRIDDLGHDPGFTFFIP
jgi:hypothetical protein